MSVKIGAYLTILAGAMMLFSACGSGSSTNSQIVMASVNNPVLVNYSTTVYANFSNYTSLVKFGSPITFTVTPDTDSLSKVNPNTATFSHFSTITSRVVNTDVGGMAWVTLKSTLPGRYVVRATSNVSHLGGVTTVTFIDQPAAVEVRVGLKKPLTNVGRLDFDLLNTGPSLVFDNFSGIQSPLLLAEDTTPFDTQSTIPSIGIASGDTNLHVTSLQGINMAGGINSKGLPIPLFMFHYVPIANSVPDFILANVSCEAADQYSTPIPLSLYIISVKYFDSAGNLMVSVIP
jgi:hypothetical protein